MNKQILLGLDRGVWYFDIRTICEKVVELELDGVEIQIEHPEIFKYFPDTGEIKNILKDYDLKHISVHGPIKDINISSYNPRIRNTSLKELKETVKFASKISDKIEYIVIHGGQNSFRSPSNFERSFLPKAIQFTVDVFKEVITDCEELGIPLSVENMTFSSWRLSSKIRYLDEIFTKVPNLKFTFDYAHGLLGSHRYSDRVLNRYKNRLISVHIGRYFEIRNIYDSIKFVNPFIIVEPHHLTQERDVFEQLAKIIPRMRALV